MCMLHTKQQEPVRLYLALRIFFRIFEFSHLEFFLEACVESSRLLFKVCFVISLLLRDILL